MTTKKDAKPDTEAEVATETVATTLLSDLAPKPVPVYTEPDDNELRWRTEEVGAKFRVHVINAAGESFNTLAKTEAEGKTSLLNALGVK